MKKSTKSAGSRKHSDESPQLPAAEVFEGSPFVQQLLELQRSATDLSEQLHQWWLNNDDCVLACEMRRVGVDIQSPDAEAVLAVGVAEGIPADVQGLRWSIEQFLRATQAKLSAVMLETTPAVMVAAAAAE